MGDPEYVFSGSTWPSILADDMSLSTDYCPASTGLNERIGLLSTVEIDIGIPANATIQVRHAFDMLDDTLLAMRNRESASRTIQGSSAGDAIPPARGDVSMYLAHQDSQSTPPPEKKKQPAAKKKTGTAAKANLLAPDTAKPAIIPATTAPGQTPAAGATTSKPNDGKSGTLVPAQSPQIQMTTFLWIGFGFTVSILIFLMVTVYIPPPKGSQGRAIMKVLASLCCGFAGGFLTGAALFDATWGGPVLKVSLSGSAGMALFFTVFFFLYEKVADGEYLGGDDAIAIDIPKNWTLKTVADTLAARMSKGIDYTALKPEELNAGMKSQPLRSRTVENLLMSLRYVTTGQVIRPYTVKKENDHYAFKIEEK